jgi:hypothetical protein
MECMLMKYFEAKFGIYYEFLLMDPHDIIEKNIYLINGKILVNEQFQRLKKIHSDSNKLFSINEYNF